MNEMIKKYWEHTRSNFAHIKYNWEIIKGSRRENHFKSTIFKHIDFTNKVVIDYGCGGGYLGKYMFENYGIKKYIGIDVAERSLIASYEHLEKYRDKIKLRLTPQDFKIFNADIFISLACIQHFPSVLYLDDFLENINGSNIEYVFLHIRYGIKTKYKNPYTEAGGNVVDAGRTNRKYISKRLDNYKLVKVFDFRKPSSAMYLIYKVKDVKNV